MIVHLLVRTNIPPKENKLLKRLVSNNDQLVWITSNSNFFDINMSIIRLYIHINQMSMIHFEITIDTKVLNLLFTPDEDVVVVDGEVYDLVDVFDHLDLLVSEGV